MKKRILSALAILITTIAISTHSFASSFAPVQGNPLEQPVVIRTTCYTDTGTTASGKQTRHGIIAGKAEWEGMVALLYTYKYIDGEPVPMELIGIYEVLDQGRGIEISEGVYSLPAGQSIDIWCESQAEVDEFISQYGDYTLMILVDGKG